MELAFEYDPEKSKANKIKHGIDFERAKSLWEDADLLEIPAKTIDEPRILCIGRIKSKHYSAVITYRGDNIRIISVRRSRQQEIDLYEENSEN